MLKLSNRILVFCILLMVQLVQAQQVAQVTGKVENANTADPIANIQVQITGTSFSTLTNADGAFKFENIPQGNYVFEFTGPDVLPQRMNVNAKEEQVNIGTIMLSPGMEIEDNLNNEDVIPTILLSEGDLDGNKGGGSQNTAGLLNASRDIFANKAAFAFSAVWFRIRGYDSENTELYMNGVPVNDVENGRPYWAFWGGLNDVTRNRTSTIGLGANDFGFGSFGGASMLDVRASKQRKQFRVSYATSNRSYQHRLMATYNSGLLPGDWAISASASWRYAPDGMYAKGSYYNALSYFLSVEKILGDHSISLTAFGAPRVRGKAGPAIKEMFTLSNDRYYNPYWGYQTGEDGKQQVRNSRVAVTNMPMAILTHEWQKKSTSLMNSVSFQMGRNGSTALDWFEAPDPRPNYYRKLPSFALDSEVGDKLEDAFQEDPNVLHINWDNLYDINRHNFQNIANANGSGDTVSGNRAHYILTDRRYDAKKLNFASTFKTTVADVLTLNGGVTYQWYNGHNYQLVDDLLGADFYVDLDRFAIRDTETDTTLTDAYFQNDAECPNCIREQGDKHGYDYESQIHKGGAWVQATLSLNKFDFFAAGRLNYTRFWRKGNIANGRFPESLGPGEVQNYLNYAVKGGATYKLNGRNYFYANGMYMTRAPYFRNAYTSARTRDEVVPGLESERIYGGEFGYLLRAPNIKAKFTGFYTQFSNQTFNRSFFLDNAIRTEDGTTRGGFVNYIMTGVEKRHMGIEAAAEYSLNNGISFSGALAMGEYIYTARPTISTYFDNTQTKLGEDRTAYIKNFYVSGSPQIAGNVGFRYRSPKYWSLSFNFNYFGNSWADFNPDRRTLLAVSYINDPTYQEQTIDPESKLWDDIIAQERLPNNFTADVFFSKSWKINDFFIYLNVGVNNILNNTNIVTRGFEQFRFDYREKDVDRFPNRYYTGYGINYFISLTFRM